MKFIVPVILLFILHSLLSGLDTNDTGLAYTVRLFNTENFTSFKSALNPGNVLGNYSGLDGMLKYYADMTFKSGPVSFQAADIGCLEAATDATLTNRVAEIYISDHAGTFFFDAGKKKITQSVSFIASPVDFILNVSNDISKNKTYNLEFSEGKFMANTDWYSDFGVFGFCYIPEIDFTNSAPVYFSSPQAEQEELRYSVDIYGIDASLAVSHDEIWREGAGLSATIGDCIEIHSEGAFLENKNRTVLQTNQVITGFDPVRMKTIYSPFLTNTEQTLYNVAEVVAGGSYNTDLFTIMIEYYYNGGGFDFGEWNGIRKSLQDFRGSYDSPPGSVNSFPNLGAMMNFIQTNGMLDLCRHYAMIRLSNPASEKMGLSCATLMNLEDFSGMEILTACYTGWDHLTLTGGFTFDFGEDYSEFKLKGQDWTVSLEIEIDI